MGRSKWPSGARGTRQEVSTAGYDPALGLIYGNPNQSPTGPGLIVPQTVPASGDRYLFVLAAFQLNAGEIARIVGIRQYLSIAAFPFTSGGDAGPAFDYRYVLEQPVTSPMWHFSDANVSWHLRRYTSQPQPRFNPNNQQNVAYKTSIQPALLYVSPPKLGYSAPAGGRPPGTVLVPDLGSFQDIRFPWQNDKAWDRTLDVEVEGPATFAFYASVAQTNPDTRPVMTLPGTLPGGTSTAFVPEELFIQNFPTSYYYRIAGSLIYETPSFYEDDDRPTWCRPGVDGPLPVRKGGAPPPRSGGDGNRPSQPKRDR